MQLKVRKIPARSHYSRRGKNARSAAGAISGLGRGSRARKILRLRRAGTAVGHRPARRSDAVCLVEEHPPRGHAGVPDGALVSRRAAGGDAPSRAAAGTGHHPARSGDPERLRGQSAGLLGGPRAVPAGAGSRGTGAGQPGPEARATAARPALRAEGRDRGAPAPHTELPQPRLLRLRRLYGSPEHLLDGIGPRGRAREGAAGRMRHGFRARHFRLARGGARTARAAVPRRRLQDHDDAGGADRRIVEHGKGLDRRFPPHGHLPCAGHLRVACRRASGLLPVPAAPMLHPGAGRPAGHFALGLALCAGIGMECPGDPSGSRVHALRRGALALSPAPDSQPAGGHGAGFPGVRSGTDVRGQLRAWCGELSAGLSPVHRAG